MRRSWLGSKKEVKDTEEDQPNLLDYLSSGTRFEQERRLERLGRIARVVSGLNFRYSGEYPSQKVVETHMVIQRVNKNSLLDVCDLDYARWGVRICVKINGRPIYITHRAVKEKARYSIVPRDGHNIVVCDEPLSVKPCESTLVSLIKVLSSDETKRNMKSVMNEEVSDYLERLMQEYPPLVDDKLHQELLNQTAAYHIPPIMKSEVLTALLNRVLSVGRFSMLGMEEQIKNTIVPLRIRLDNKLRDIAQEVLSGIAKLIVYNAAWEGEGLRGFLEQKLPELDFQHPTSEFQKDAEALLLVLGMRRLDISIVRSAVYPHRHPPDYYTKRRDDLWSSVSNDVRELFESKYGDLS